MHISEIAPEENGIKCGCVCPACGAALQARRGHGKRRPHFAHYGSFTCDPVHAQQTGLHMMAKKILSENNEILLPGWSLSRADATPTDGDKTFFSLVKIDLPSVTARKYEYRFIEAEKRFTDMTTDALIEIRGQLCAVEIAVTHFTDDLKRRKAQSLALPMLEIDLSRWINETEKGKIVDAVLFASNNRRWIYNPKQDAAIKEKRSEYRHKADELASARKKRSIRDDNEAEEWFIRFGFKGLRWYPFYMDIPISGDSVFPCDRRIWQGRLFEEYVYRTIGDFTIDQVQKRLSAGDLDPYATNRDERVLYEVISKYFEYMELIGFVSRNGAVWHVDKPHTTVPPNQRAARALRAILAHVDTSTPNIDVVIEKELNRRFF